MTVLGRALRDVGGMLGLASRLFGNHWPQLLALYLAGAAGRMAFLWLALWLSKFNSLLGTAMLPLAPLCVLLSVVVMLRVCADSLPALQNARQEGNLDSRWKVNLRVAVQALIPFVAVYASQSLLKEDARFFINTSTLDEFTNNELNANYARVVYADGWPLVVLVLVALTVRKWLSAKKLTERSLGWGILGGYLEAFWLVALGTALTKQVEQIRDWVMSRSLVDQFVQWQSHAREATNPLVQGVNHALTWAADIISNSGNLIILPVAWLAVGAVVYGTKLTAQELPTHEQVTERLKHVPNSVQKVITQVLEPVLTPLQNTIMAISKVASAGVLSMVLYCVLFALAGSGVKVLVALLTRAMVGPRTGEWQQAYLPYMVLVERGAYLILTVVLVASAVNFIFRSSAPQITPQTEPQPALPSAPAPS